MHPQSNEGGSACVHVCLPAKLYKQNQETCRDGRLMHVCKGFSGKLCDGSPVPRVYACVKKGAVEGGGGGGGGGGVTEGQVERRLLSLTQHLSHFITKSSMTNRAGAWQR